MFQIGSSVLFVCALFATVCHADVRDALRYNRLAQQRFQRQELSPTPYPAAGYRPERQFPLPAVASGSEEDAIQQQQPEPSRQAAPTNFEQVARPDATYGAPARLRQFAAQPARQQIAPQQPQQVYAAPQVTYGAPVVDTPAEPARLTAAAPAPAKSARLSADPEERDTEIDDAAEEVDVTPKNAQPKAVVPPQAATVAYFPAGAVGFVQPVAAKLITKLPAQYQTAAYVAAPAAYAAAPAAYAAQPQFYAPSAAFLQPQFGAFTAAPAQLNAAAW